MPEPRGFNVDRFISVINETDILRTNKFLVELAIPMGLLGVQNRQQYRVTTQTLEFWVEGVNLPGISLASYDNRRFGYGASEKRPYVATFSELIMTVIADAQSHNWRFFLRWMHLISNARVVDVMDEYTNDVTVGNRVLGMTPYELSYKNEYTTDMRIIVYDNTGTEAKRIWLRDAFPLSMADNLQLSWADNNSIMRFPVTMTFTDFHMESVLEESQ